MKTKDKKGNKKKTDDDNNFSLNERQVRAQMMFKTTLRNQIDLTNIVDNKANIMLTINSGIITVGIPLLFRLIGKPAFRIYPVSVLLLTCLFIHCFCYTGNPACQDGWRYQPQQHRESATPTFSFFGNFFKMSQNDYRMGLKKVVETLSCWTRRSSTTCTTLAFPWKKIQPLAYDLQRLHGWDGRNGNCLCNRFCF
ncbi:MAG: hypothetical protein R2788_17680 [Saprospiraceae bacterium]